MTARLSAFPVTDGGFDRGAFMAAVATVHARMDDRYKVVPLQGVAAALDEHGIGAKVGADSQRKACQDCGQTKRLDQFWLGRSGKRQDICGTCMQVRVEKGRAASGKPRTVGAEIQQLMREASKPAEAPREPIEAAEPASLPAEPTALVAQEAAPVASSPDPIPTPSEQVEVTDDWASNLELKIDRLTNEVSRLGKVVQGWENAEFTRIELREGQYFDLLTLLIRRHEQALVYGPNLGDLLNRLERLLVQMREEDGVE